MSDEQNWQEQAIADGIADADAGKLTDLQSVKKRWSTMQFVAREMDLHLQAEAVQDAVQHAVSLALEHMSSATLSPAHVEDEREAFEQRYPYVKGLGFDGKRYAKLHDGAWQVISEVEGNLQWNAWQARAALSAPPAAGVPVGSTYVECRQCEECRHAGINDAAVGVAACHDCDWSGPEPDEDQCPECHRENCMAAACPECGARYVLVASEDIAAPTPPASEQQRAVEAILSFTDGDGQSAFEAMCLEQRRDIERDQALEWKYVNSVTFDRFIGFSAACNRIRAELLRLNPHLAKGEGV